MKHTMKTLMCKFGGSLAALALLVTTVSVNTCCSWYGHQSELPDGAKKLRKF